MSASLCFLMISLVIAHRGASGEAPENTMAAFERAIEMKVDLIELDIHFSKDGEIMVIHDETVDRTTDGRGAIAEMTRNEVQALDAGSWFSPRFEGERAPTLSEVLELVKPTPVNLLIEIKQGRGLPHGFEKRLIQAIQEHNILSRVIVQSFNHAAVRKVKEENPSIATGALIDYRSPDPVSEVKAAGAETLGLKSSLVTREIIEKAHRNGLRVFVWTVNKLARIRKMLILGVDGVITDYPSRVRRSQ
ncbi:glycerophosphodiester phosphodiesterase [Acidobacteria bacterium AH-259-G07]|nr:glycerophosphodiester phosphodiesterase [Acidobacteria bacterium AH-259-G07]